MGPRTRRGRRRRDARRLGVRFRRRIDEAQGLSVEHWGERGIRGGSQLGAQMAGAVGTLEGFGGGASAAGGRLPTDGDLSNVERIDECLRLQAAWVREVTQWLLKRRLVSEQLGASERATRLCRVRRRGCRRDGPESGTQKRAGPDRAPGTPARKGRPRGRAGPSRAGRPETRGKAGRTLHPRGRGPRGPRRTRAAVRSRGRRPRGQFCWGAVGAEAESG